VTRVAAIITAAGSGTRMGTRKQFLELAPGERILDRVVTTCRAVASWVAIVVPPGSGWDGQPVDAVVAGGASRLESVSAGVAAVPDDIDVVVVHSASHPFASVDLVRRLIAAIEAGADGAVPFLAAVDVIKRRDGDGTLTTVGRQGLGSAQAPMAYARPSLDRALAAVSGAAVVEESAAVEGIGGKVVAVAGESTNLHVTDPTSLAVVRALAGLDLSGLPDLPGPSIG
jgi:2-C-methyl-D-erythritol 4-phosphate cytidylyltransferase